MQKKEVICLSLARNFWVVNLGANADYYQNYQIRQNWYLKYQTADPASLSYKLVNTCFFLYK